jgi:uncharacterized protein YdaU (DUF1376 family)
MAKNPAFPFYAQDFLVDVSEWSAEEVGVYVRLLATQWINGSINSEPERLIISGGPEVLKAWPTVCTKFKKGDDGRLRNNKLEEIREEKNFFLKKQSENGKKGAEARWRNDADANSAPNAEPINDTNSESVAFIIEEEKEEEKEKGKENGKARKKPEGEFPEAVEAYNKFILDKTGAPAILDGAQGAAMKKILKYFNSIETVKDEKFTAVECLEILFKNWDKLDNFTAGQLKLTQINSNLINIINKVKNGNQNNNEQRRDLKTAAEFFRNIKVAEN